ncbi:alkyl sulfatase C-terminal domain-containing protein [Mycobacterium sp. 360MFTsu5.1]|uniref:alkyl sulfatase C-terminal domain-containing protein n=1 Tax=Mycobacterium sp. 360MFTsu5.1 TaxID=1172186 RepID=UPI00037A3EA5|nr:alkyl sulfatase C-terminal domain-containing protein [Mycobacterium sp. 360MFTsu5.1]
MIGLKLTKATMSEIQLGKVKLADAISANNVTVEGKRQSVDEFVGLLDTFQLWFNIVTP